MTTADCNTPATATTRTTAEVEALIARQRAEGYTALDLFAEQYSPAVVRELRDSVLELLHKGEVAAPAAVAILSVLNSFLDLCAGDYNPAHVRVREYITDISLADELNAAVGQTLGLLVATGKLTAWM